MIEIPSAERRRTVTWHDPAILAAAGRTMDGLSFLRAIGSGALPAPPAADLIEMRLIRADPGTVRFTMPVREYAYNPLGSVHGGILTTLLDTVMGCAVHSTLEAGASYTTLDLQTRFLRAVTMELETVFAEGTVIHGGRRTVVAQARLTDEAGERVYALATSTCLVSREPSA
jgi:uncharacterized protein (TIGR00369 family)